MIESNTAVKESTGVMRQLPASDCARQQATGRLTCVNAAVWLSKNACRITSQNDIRLESAGLSSKLNDCA